MKPDDNQHKRTEPNQGCPSSAPACAPNNYRSTRNPPNNENIGIESHQIFPPFDDTREMRNSTSVSLVGVHNNADHNGEGRRHSRRPNRVDFSNSISQSETRPRTYADKVRSDSTGCRPRHSSAASRHSNEGAAGSNGNYRGQGRHDSTSRSGHHTRQLDMGYQEKKDEMAYLQMPPPPVPKYPRNRMRDTPPPFIDAPIRRNSWSCPRDLSASNGQVHFHSGQIPFEHRNERRGERRFGVSSDVENDYRRDYSKNDRKFRRPIQSTNGNYRQERTKSHRDTNHRRSRDSYSQSCQPHHSGDMRGFENYQNAPFPNKDQYSQFYESFYQTRPPTPTPPPPPPPPPPPRPCSSKNSDQCRIGPAGKACHGSAINVDTMPYDARSGSNSEFMPLQCGFNDEINSTNLALMISLQSPEATPAHAAQSMNSEDSNLECRKQQNGDHGDCPTDQMLVATNVNKNEGKGYEVKRRTESFDNEIAEEMARAQQMAIPVNFNKSRAKVSDLNPEANEFSPTLQGANGELVKMVKMNGLSYFIPEDLHPVSNPNYIVSTAEDRNSSSDEDTQHVTRFHTENITMAMQNASLYDDNNNYTNANNNRVPTLELSQHTNASIVTDPYAAQLSLNSAHPNVHSIPPDHHQIPNRLTQNVCHDDCIQSFIRPEPVYVTPVDMYAGDYQHHYSVPQQTLAPSPTYQTVVNVEQNDQVMYSHILATHEAMIQSQHVDHLTPTHQVQYQHVQQVQYHQFPQVQCQYHQVQSPHPYQQNQIFVTLPSQTPQPVSPVLIASPVTGLIPVDPTPANVNTLTTFGQSTPTPVIYGQAEAQRANAPLQPPVMNFQTYWTTIENGPSEPILPENYNLTGMYSNEEKYNQRSIDKTFSKNESENEFARNVIAKFVKMVKRCERTSSSPLSDSELIEKLYTKTTGILFGLQPSLAHSENGQKKCFEEQKSGSETVDMVEKMSEESSEENVTSRKSTDSSEDDAS